MAEHHEFYRRARWYDIVFERDVGRDLDFLSGLYRREHGRPPASVVDLASGPGYHALGFAERGLRATAVDLRPEMLELGEEKARARGVEVEWRSEDMRELELEEPVDLAICLFDGLDALQTDEDLVRHMRSAAENLTPGGLYVIDLTHPRDSGYGGYGAFRYEGRRDGVHVVIDWAVNEPLPDPVTGVCETEIRITVEGEGEPQVLHDTARERFLTAREISLLAALSGRLRPIAWYGDFDPDVVLDAGPDSRRMIAVLEQTA